MNVEADRERLGPGNAGAMFHVIRHARLPLCITDPHQPDNPIVFVNLAFCELTGYSEDEVMGRNCRFLQGTGTSAESVEKVRDIIARGKVDTVELVNYRKDGSEFVNALQIGPIHDDTGKLLYFFGSQLDVTEKREMERRARQLADDEIFHRLRNVVNVMSVIARMTSKNHHDTSEFGQQLTERLAALSAVHFSSTRTNGQIGLNDLARAIIEAYAPINERQFEIEGPETKLSSVLASPLSLALHELSTNAVKYGALGAEEGKVSVSWQEQHVDGDACLVLVWRETGGPEPKAPEKLGGTEIVRKIVGATGGTLDLDWQRSGLVVTLTLPTQSLR